MIDLPDTRIRPVLISAGVFLLLIIEVVGYQIDPEISITPFYLLPVALFVWYLGSRVGTLLAFASVLAWFMTRLRAGSNYSAAWIEYWNIAVRLIFFVIIIYLLSKLKWAVQREKNLSRTDFTTGISNRRHFFEMLNMELNKARRYSHPVTIAYMDIDNFKLINDRYGHDSGDELLRQVAATIKDRIRSVDVVSRLGGDEFGILLPETGYEAAQKVGEKIQEGVDNVARQKKWPVSLSIGFVTCTGPNISADEFVKKADDLMYSAKKNGKHKIGHLVIGD